MSIKDNDIKLQLYKQAYEQGTPLISDEAYDFFIRTNKFSSDPDEPCTTLKKSKHSIKHDIPMGSLSKIYPDETPDKISKWLTSYFKHLDKMRYIGDHYLAMQPKVDGIAFSARYNKQGLLKDVATRGNKLEGSDITKKVLALELLPSNLKTTFTKDLVVRGEFFIKEEDFQNINSEYNNARNTVAGLFNTLDNSSNFNKDFKISVYLYTFLFYDSETLQFMDEGYTSTLYPIELMDVFTKIENGKGLFQTIMLNSSFNLKVLDEDINKHFSYFKSSNSKDIDGVVLKSISPYIHNKLNAYPKPHHSIALKMPSDAKETIVTDLYYTVGTTGRETPIAIVTPVHFDNGTICKISVGSRETVNKLGLKIGSKVIVEYRGDVIPKISKVIG